MSKAVVSADPAADEAARCGLVMMCDVDIGLPDATRTHTLEVARGFAGLGLDVDLVARGPDPRLAGVRYAAAEGAEAQRVRRLITLNSQTIGLLWRRRASARRFYVRDKWTCFPAVLAARLLGYHVVLQVDGVPYGRGADEGSPAARLLKLIVAIAMGRLVHGVLAVTPAIRALVIDLAHVPADRVSVIPNGVDLDLFQPLPRAKAIDRLGLDKACRYIVFVGGFYEWADFDTMLAAFAAAAAAQPDARLLLVGDGAERGVIERRAHELGVGDRLIITGFVHDRSRVRDYLSAATVTLLVHRREKVSRTGASPIKLMEYLATGRAVVTVEFAGGSEMVKEAGAGVLVPAGVEPLAKAILDLLDADRADRLGASGRRYAERHLSWASVVERTLPLFRLERDAR
jgi:glycosyltransferase involved in cell wall biosynthesis